MNDAYRSFEEQYRHHQGFRVSDAPFDELVPAEVIASPLGQGAVAAHPVTPPPLPRQAPRSRRIVLPLVLFTLTALSTSLMGGWQYAVAIMTILLCHEMGHFLQALRYGVRASLPFFIPLPLISPLGTLGAVIGMDARVPHRRALFDIGITGPLAGLVPTLIFLFLGIQWSEFVPPRPGGMTLGVPWLFSIVADSIHGPRPDGLVFLMHPVAFAAWAGLLLTSLNLMPIGQLDGGHVLYGIIHRRAHLVASGLLLLAVVVVIALQYYWWILMLMLLMVMGPKHPPTANDRPPLGLGRAVLGVLTLAFIPLGLTPEPIREIRPEPPPGEWVETGFAHEGTTIVGTEAVAPAPAAPPRMGHGGASPPGRPPAAGGGGSLGAAPPLEVDRALLGCLDPPLVDARRPALL